MEVTYALTADDYVNHQLYLASTSDRIRSNRLRSHVIATLALGVLALFFYLQDNIYLMFYFLFFTVICGILFPVYSRRRYMKHYENFVRENYKDRFNELIFIKVDNNSLLTKDKISEGCINMSEISEIVEVSSAIYLRLTTNMSLILPKQQIARFPELRHELLRIATQLQIPYINALGWSWK
ncbi:hypothetical protein [Hymenobacter sp. UYP22]|uniref:hypothetical protein n=1 Tax=Hymenobacter sp. UYP22 TaxID=3156348 RepID=UPI00339A8F90